MKAIKQLKLIPLLAAILSLSTVSVHAGSAALNYISDDSLVENSLSGINIYSSKKDNTFYLEFGQVLKENATLSLVDQQENIIYSENLFANKSYKGKPFSVGVLPSGIYTIEVKTGNKTYWKKVKISR